MKRVYIAVNLPDAHLVKGILEGENIDAVVQGEYLFNIRGEVPVTPETSPSVWVVDESDYERALEVLSELHVGEGPLAQAGAEWRCSQCGETNGPQFTQCWQCGKDRTF